MRFAELLLAIGAARADAPAPPELHESGLESGLRLVVAPQAGGAGDGAVAAVLVLPFGWTDDRAQSGRGFAALLADYVTFEGEVGATWSADLEPERLCFHGTFARETLAEALSTLARRLTADAVEETRFSQVGEAWRAPTPASTDRFREAAWPTTRLGRRPRGAAEERAPTREEFQRFLGERCGCEGAVLVVAGAAPTAQCELAASRAFAGFPRARGVAPREPIEPYPARPRRTAAPTGASEALIGFRTAWRDDPAGDGLALARAFLAQLAGGREALFERTRQGALMAFRAGDEAGAARLREAFAARIEALAAGRPLSGGELAAALDRLDGELAEAAASPAGLARLLADGASMHEDPLAAFGRRRRLEAAGAEAAGAALRGLLPPRGLIEVSAWFPRPAPEGS